MNATPTVRIGSHSVRLVTNVRHMIKILVTAACASSGDFSNDQVNGKIEHEPDVTFRSVSDESQLREATQASKDETARVARFESFKRMEKIAFRRKREVRRMENIANRRKRDAKLEQKKTEPANRISDVLKTTRADPNLRDLVMVKNLTKQLRLETPTMVKKPRKQQRSKKSPNLIRRARQQERTLHVIVTTDQRDREWLGSMVGDTIVAVTTMRSKRGAQRDERKQKMRAAAKAAAMQKAKSSRERKKRGREGRGKVCLSNT